MHLMSNVAIMNAWCSLFNQVGVYDVKSWLFSQAPKTSLEVICIDPEKHQVVALFVSVKLKTKGLKL